MRGDTYTKDLIIIQVYSNDNANITTKTFTKGLKCNCISFILKFSDKENLFSSRGGTPIFMSVHQANKN